MQLIFSQQMNRMASIATGMNKHKNALELGAPGWCRPKTVGRENVIFGGKLEWKMDWNGVFAVCNS